MIKPLQSQTIVIYPKGLETIALLKEGNKVIKQASAKCNPSDTYDFNIGAKLAFSRLVGGIYIGGVDMAIDTIREVKRPAKVGEWIKVIDGVGHLASVGEIHKVIGLSVNYSGWVYIDAGVRKDCLRNTQYVVLENYQPKPRRKQVKNPSRLHQPKRTIHELAKRWEDKQ